MAPALLGAYLAADSEQGRVVLRLTEVEAYAGADDPGSHAFRGRTPRTTVMFGPPAHLYVYFTYGMHWCANVICESDGAPAAVLFRAGEVVEGAALAFSRRSAARQPRDLARGPARLAQALGITGDDNGTDLSRPGSRITLIPPETPAAKVLGGPRVGVAGAGAARPWRFWLPGEPSVSVYRPAIPRRRAGALSGRLSP